MIIGAGNGALGAALSLARAGLKPLVIEQHNLPGGCATSIVRGRFEFDATLHCMLHENPPTNYKVAFERFNLQEQFVEIPNVLNLTYVDKQTSETVNRVYSIGIEAFSKKLHEYMPKFSDKIDAFLGFMGGFMEAMDYCGSPDFDPAVLEKRYPEFVKFRNKPVKDAFDAFDLPMDLRAVFGMLWFYIEANMEDTTCETYIPGYMCFMTVPTRFPKETCTVILLRWKPSSETTAAMSGTTQRLRRFMSRTAGSSLLRPIRATKLKLRE